MRIIQQSESVVEIAKALIAASGELENVSKNAANPHFRSKYADLAGILNSVRPVLAKYGLAVTQFPAYDPANKVVAVETMLVHTSGQWISGIVGAPTTKPDAQGVGSAITYCRRYSLAAVLGIAQEDDDGEAAVGRGRGAKASNDNQKKESEVYDDQFFRWLLVASNLDEVMDVWDSAPERLKKTREFKDAAKAAKERVA